MAEQDKRASKAKAKAKRSGRTTGLAGLLAVIALIAMWLSDCIPGFGIGSGTRDGEAELAEEAEPAKPAEPEPPEPTELEQPTMPKPTTLRLTVDARGCSVDGGELFECETLCEREQLFDKVDAVILDAKDGPHGVVVKVLDCIASKNLEAAITRE